MPRLRATSALELSALAGLRASAQVQTNLQAVHKMRAGAGVLARAINHKDGVLERRKEGRRNARVACGASEVRERQRTRLRARHDHTECASFGEPEGDRGT